MTADDFEAAVVVRAAASGIALPSDRARQLASHARLVLAENAQLHLTTVTEPAEFLERHLGESFEGAALLDEAATGTLVDLGSGNGYPGLAIAIARPGLRPILAESSARKAAFLRRALAASGVWGGLVLERSVQRARDLEPYAPIDVLVTRAAGGWETIVPRLAESLRPGARALIWAGAAARNTISRASWRGFDLVGSHALPQRRASWGYQLTRRG